MQLERIEVYLTFNLDLYQRDKGLAYHDLGKILIGWARKLYRNELFRLNIHYQKIVIFAVGRRPIFRNGVINVKSQ